MSFSEAAAYLLGLGPETLTIKLGLRNTELLLHALDNPHRAFPSVQIAGTNGKGSTASMIESICRAAGMKTGLYTSPHLSSITERIRINGSEITEAEFAGYTATIKDASQRLVESGALQALPTFFEHVTAIALHAFREQSIDLAILETGLGGRLDSTTAAEASYVGITAIDMDHEEYLGNTLELITAEKAATIRPGVKVVIGRQEPEVLKVLLTRCEEVRVEPIHGSSVTVLSDGERRTFKTPAHTYAGLRLGLLGSHQEENAVVAILLAEQLGLQFEIPRVAIIKGLEDVQHPGRLELFSSEPEILLDGAHNPAGAMALSRYLSVNQSAANRPLTMVFGAMREKQLDHMAQVLFYWAERLILTKVDNPRSAETDWLLPLAEKYARGSIHTVNNASEAFEMALRITPPRGLICVTGSLYLIGELRPKILKLLRDKEGLE